MNTSTTLWAFDCEFLPTGLKGDPANVHSVQFSDGFNDHYFIETPEALKRWLHNRSHSLKHIFGFNMLCDLGAMKEWLGAGNVQAFKFRGRLIGKIRYGSARIKAYDSMSLLVNFGLRRLADVGDVVGIPKLPKPSFLGLRKWVSDKEHRQFQAYAVQDAIITSKATRWLIEKNKCDPRLHTSAGTLAGEYFSFPKRHAQAKGRILMPPIERAIGQCTSAGRSEAFVTGFTPDVTYNDVKSLYPVSILTTRALMIDRVIPCDPDDLLVNGDLNNTEYGWVVGTFRTQNKLWGLPIQARNVTYVTGYLNGLYHTFDLAAAKAQIIHATKAYKPIFSKQRQKAHDDFAEMLTARLEGKMDKRKARYAKAILNSTYGKLGQSHPEAKTTNFLAYSTILAHSHLIMSRLFDVCPTKILGMDTDSIFCQHDMTGRYGDLSDGEYSIPLILEVKGKGDLAMFRAKTYMLRQEGKPIRVYGRHVWHYFLEDYFSLWTRKEYPFKTRIQVKHTLKTKQRKALELPLGFWCEKPVRLTEEKISKLLQADNKRKRESYESFKLFQNRESQDSEPYVMDKILFNSQFEYPPKSHEKFPYLKINRYYTKPQRAELQNLSR